MEYDMKKWRDVATLLPDRETFQNLDIGLQKKKYYVTCYLPGLRDGVPRCVLDIGAGAGVFCHVCQELGHETLAVLLGSGSTSCSGYEKACEYFDVPVLNFIWGSKPACIKDNSFDVVNSQGMIGDNKVEVWPAILDDMLRVLKPGGILLLAANHESGTKYASVINNWAKTARVELIEHWRKKTVWKWKKSE